MSVSKRLTNHPYHQQLHHNQATTNNDPKLAEEMSCLNMSHSLPRPTVAQPARDNKSPHPDINSENAQTVNQLAAIPDIVVKLLDVAKPSKDICDLARIIIEQNIKLICWDFDQTILGMHTGGQAYASECIHHLCAKVSAHFLSFVRYLTQHVPGVAHGVVSFSDIRFGQAHDNKAVTKINDPILGGSDLITAVLEKSFGYPRPKFTVVSYYPAFLKRPNHKNDHIKRVCIANHIDNLNNVLLIDDCLDNLRHAKQLGCHIWQVPPKSEFNSKTIITDPFPDH